MKRIQLFEFEDFGWFPNWLRTCMTNLIMVLHKILGANEVLADLISRILKEQNVFRIVDLGSGSGGGMPEVVETIHKIEGLEDVELVMTDLYPSKEVVKKYRQNYGHKIDYHETSIDATDIASAPNGLKTMINSFHHMRPTQAKKILASAQVSKQPILIYEMAENQMPLVLWWLLLPLSLLILMIMVLFMTPFVKPLTWQQLVFTYLIPIIPICYAWDGQASLPRMYSQNDIEELLQKLPPDNYKWEKGIAKKKNGKKLGTYIIGAQI